MTIPPGRDGIVEASGLSGPALGFGSSLTLTAPAGAQVTGVPLTAAGYRGEVAADGRTAVYTAVSAERPWQTGSFPFVLAVPADAGAGDAARLLRAAARGRGGRRQGERGMSGDGGAAVTGAVPPRAGVPLGYR